MTPITVTGAAGYLGRHIVGAARAAGHPVRAVIRSVALPEWAGDAGVEVVTHDLAAGGDAADVFGPARVVIHAAAGSGDDAAHARDTLAATDALLAALAPGVRLVLVSSFSVYATAAIPAGATLDETSPVDRDPARRDAYARAKIAQEMRAVEAAQTRGIDLRIARPGAIWGEGRDWTARLGWKRGGRVVCVGGDATVPAIHVADCAARLVALATASDGPPDDLPAMDGGGRIRIVNLVSAHPPSQVEWIEALGLSPVRVPAKPVMKVAALLDLVADLVPSLDRRLPTGLREGTLASRFRPLRYATARAEDWLGPLADRPFDLRADP